MIAKNIKIREVSRMEERKVSEIENYYEAKKQTLFHLLICNRGSVDRITENISAALLIIILFL